MRFLRKYNSQFIGVILISAILYFGSYCGLRAIHLPPKLIVSGKAGTVQSGAFEGMQTNDAPIKIPYGMGKMLNWTYKPINDFCRVKTGFGLYFMDPNERGTNFIEMPQF
ncbi:MAG: hypothetical protein ACKVJU_01520 [Verrucomicrobiales bacterium]